MENLMILAVEKALENQITEAQVKANQTVQVTVLAMVSLIMVNLITMEVVRALVTVNQMVPVTDLAMVNQITTRDLENQITAVLDMENQMVLEKESLTMMRDQLMTMTL